MYLPADTVSAVVMATDSPDSGDSELKLSPEIASSTSSSIYIRWAWEGQCPVQVRGFRVHYHRLSSTYVQQSNMLPPSTNSYGIGNLVADTYYKVCVTMYCNESSPLKECVDASTTSWHIPVSIGSSIGAVLALSIIVLIVLLSRCPGLMRAPRTAAAESSKYDSMSSHYHDDRYEMSDTTTHCHDEDVFSQNSEGDSSADGKASYKHLHHHPNHHPLHSSPQSLADRLCNGSRLTNGVSKPPANTAQFGRHLRTLSLTERRHNPNHPYRNRRARLAHLHANFHSIQSEPGGIQRRPSPRVSITDLPTTSMGGDPRTARPTSSSVTNISSIKAGSSHHYQRAGALRDHPRIHSTIDSTTSSSDPSMSDSRSAEPRPTRKPLLKHLSKTIHMSIDGDTLV